MDNRDFFPKIFQEGQAKFQKGLLQDAIRHFQYCTNHQYKIQESQFYLGMIQFYHMHIPEAFVSFQSAMSSNSYSHSGACYYLGALCEFLGNETEAIMYYKRAIDDASNSLYPLMAYKALAKYGENDSYKRKAMQIFEVQPEILAQEKFLIEAFQAWIQGDMEIAQESFFLAKEEDRTHFEPYFYLAQFYFGWGHDEDSLQYWSILEKKFDLTFLGLLPRMRILYVRKEYKKALVLWKLYQKLIPNLGARECFYSGLLYSHMGQISLAIAAYEKAVALDPLYFTAFFNLGVCFQKKGEFLRAIRAYEVAFALEGDNPLPLYNLALVYFEQRNYIRAVFYLDKVSQIAPNLLDAKESAQYITYLNMLEHKGGFRESRILFYWMLGVLVFISVILGILHFLGVL